MLLFGVCFVLYNGINYFLFRKSKFQSVEISCE